MALLATRILSHPDLARIVASLPTSLTWKQLQLALEVQEQTKKMVGQL